MKIQDWDLVHFCVCYNIKNKRKRERTPQKIDAYKSFSFFERKCIQKMSFPLNKSGSKFKNFGVLS